MLSRWVAGLAVGLGLAGAAQAALISLGDGTVKDTATNLIWLQDWSLGGSGTWPTQNAWAESLNFAASDAWSLPSKEQLTNLVAAYGWLSLVPEFSNVQTSGEYWTNTSLPGVPGHYIVSYSGTASVMADHIPDFAVAVRLGDVAAPVPEPQSVALALLALGAAAAARRRRAR